MERRLSCAFIFRSLSVLHLCSTPSTSDIHLSSLLFDLRGHRKPGQESGKKRRCGWKRSVFRVRYYRGSHDARPVAVSRRIDEFEKYLKEARPCNDCDQQCLLSFMKCTFTRKMLHRRGIPHRMLRISITIQCPIQSQVLEFSSHG